MSSSHASRTTVEVNGRPMSYLHAGSPDDPPVLLLHGTYWSRVWLPVLPGLGEVAHAVAPDFPGFGRSAGELDVASASVPAMAETAGRFVDALGWSRYSVVGHDIGGGVAQHLAAHDPRVERLGLVNGVVLDSWPVPGVAKFRDPAARAATTTEDLLTARRHSMSKAVARPMSDDEVDDYVSPWRDPARVRSWLAMAAAADPRYTLDLVEGLARRHVPTLLVWGEDDEFQRIEFAERFVQQMPDAVLERVPGRHIPQEDQPERVVALLSAFVSGRR